jgi:hypothetical protein
MELAASAAIPAPTMAAAEPMSATPSATFLPVLLAPVVFPVCAVISHRLLG